MSFDALAWAGKCSPGSASRKLVLLALADRHNSEANGAYPSISWVVSFTSLNRKTIINALSELEAGGFISDSGERRGDTSQIKLYRLHLETVPKAEQSQKRNSSENVAKQSQKRDTDTIRTSKPKKDKPSLAKRAHKTRLPADFEPILTPATDEVVRAWPPGMLERELAQFKDRNTANGQTYDDWQAAFRTWIRNADKWRHNGGRSGTNGMGRHQPSDGLGSTARAALDVFGPMAGP